MNNKKQNICQKTHSKQLLLYQLFIIIQNFSFFYPNTLFDSFQLISK